MTLTDERSGISHQPMILMINEPKHGLIPAANDVKDEFEQLYDKRGIAR